MKKLVLAKLDHHEACQIIYLEANVQTFRTLQNNQFISKEMKEQINKSLDEIIHEKDDIILSIIQKYKLPYSIDSYHISSDTDELYIEIYN